MSAPTTLSATTTSDAVAERPAGWLTVCELERILPDGGVAALVDGLQVAVFRLRSGELFAIDNRDPCSGANVLSRGIVGDAGGRPYVASPLHKQRFDLASGACLDDDAVRVGTHRVREVSGVVEVARGIGADLDDSAAISRA